MAAEKLRPRAAYRAIYLAAPLKFHTTLHAFTRTVPQYRIDAWQKDPRAFEKHKWRVSKDHVRGKYHYKHGPLSGLQLEEWPEPGLLGSSDLVRIAARAQAEGLQDRKFWDEVAERTVKLRDVISVSDLTVILDALVTADYRHTFVMKTLTREIIDDVDKLSLVEAAVIANSYAHFRCVSKELLVALSNHVVQLLTGQEPPYVHPGGNLKSDPGSLAVLMRAFSGMGHSPPELLKAIGAAAQDHAEALTFPDVVSLLESFVKVKHDFQGNPEFWATVASKVSNQKMAVLCPALNAVGKLHLDEPRLREALVAAVAAGLAAAPADAAPRPLGTAPAPLPAFAAPEIPAGLCRLLDSARAQESAAFALAEEPAADDGSPLVEDFFQPPAPAALEEVVDVEPAARSSKQPVPRWYNTVARDPWLPAKPQFTGFDASRSFDRNRRGFRVAEALEGLTLLWQGAEPGALPSASEVRLLTAAAPVLRSCLPGVLPGQLAACAELYAMQPGMDDVVRDIVHEAVRRSSNLEASELRRLWAAASTAGLADPYLERARRRRFPKALRRELRHQEADAADSSSGSAAAPAAPS